jgi:hypothetical protein
MRFIIGIQAEIMLSNIPEGRRCKGTTAVRAEGTYCSDSGVCKTSGQISKKIFSFLMGHWRPYYA